MTLNTALFKGIASVAISVLLVAAFWQFLSQTQPITEQQHLSLDIGCPLAQNLSVTATSPNSLSVSWDHDASGPPSDYYSIVVKELYANGTVSNSQITKDVGQNTSSTVTSTNFIQGGKTYRVYIYSFGTNCGSGTVGPSADETMPACTLSISGGDEVICRGEGVEVGVIRTGGTTPITYTWTGGYTGGSFTAYPNNTTTYYVTATDFYGCQDQSSVTVTVVPLVTEHLSVAIEEQPSCGLNNGSIRFTWTYVPGQPPYTNPFLISLDNGNTYISKTLGNIEDPITGLAPGSYTIWAKWTSNGCPKKIGSTLTLTNQAGPTVNLGSDQTICLDGTATITAVPTGGLTPYSYLWSNAETTAAISVSPATSTTYTVTVTDANGCQITDSQLISVIPHPVVTISSSSTELCYNEAITLTANVSGGPGGQTYLWQSTTGDPDLGTWNDVTGASSATYITPALTQTTHYRVKSVYGATACADATSATYTIVVAPQGQITTPVTVSSNFESACAGTIINLSVSENDPAAGELVAYYPFQGDVQDYSGSDLHLSTSSPGTLTADGLQLINNSSYTSPSTDILNTDEHTISFYMKYTASFDGNSYYRIFSYNPAGSDRSPAIFKPRYNNGIHWKYSPGNVGVEHGNVVATVGQWYHVVGVKRGAVFTLYVDGVETETIAVPDPKSAGSAPLYFGGAKVVLKDFRIYSRAFSEKEIDGQWVWYTSTSPGASVVATGQQITTTLPGQSTTYYVRWENGCGNSAWASKEVEVVQNISPVITVDQEDICEGGTVTLTVNQGEDLSDFDLQWEMSTNSGADWVEIQGADTQSYTTDPLSTNTIFRVRAAIATGGCSPVTSVVQYVYVRPDPVVSLSPLTSAICAGSSTVLSASVANNEGCGTVSWERRPSGGAWTQVGTGSNYTVPNSLTPGTYEFRVLVDCNEAGCVVTNNDIATVAVEQLPSVSLGPDIDICDTQNELTLTAVPSGGSPNYSFLWSTGQTSSQILVSPSGTTNYLVTVTDANGCTAADDVAVNVLPSPEVTSTHTSPACGNADGTITFSFSDHPSHAGIQFSIDGGQTFTTQNDNIGSYSFTGLTAGAYDLEIKWENGDCPKTVGQKVLENQFGPSIDLGADQVVCAGGSVTLNPDPTGGETPFSYLWSTGATTATIIVMPGSSAAYGVTITDNNGCTDTSSVVINVISQPSITVAQDTIFTCADEQVQLQVSVSGGSDQKSYQWSSYNSSGPPYWSTIPGATGLTYTTPNLSSDKRYKFQVIDAGTACDDPFSASIYVMVDTDPNCGNPCAVPPTLSFTVTDESCSQADGAMVPDISGGTAPFSYSWSNGATTSSLTNLTAGIYGVTITDANNCLVSGQDTVALAPDLTVSLGEDQTICQGGSVTITPQVIGGQSPFTYDWSIAEDTSFIEVNPLASNQYSLTVTDANGCSDTSQVTVNVVQDPSVTFIQDTLSTCAGTALEIEAIITGGSAFKTYQWQMQVDTFPFWLDIEGAISTTYTTPALAQTSSYHLKVTDPVSGCSNLTSQTVVIVVENCGQIVSTCSSVSSSSDDAEERVTGYITLTSTDLELIHDSGEDQTVGMRFTDLNIPQGAIVTSASIQFTVDETAQINPCNLTIFGQASDDAATFTTGSQNIISRPGTQASVTWSPPAWSPTGAKGADQQTPDISAVIQEIVNRSGYTSSSAIVIMINGTGQRIAESYDGSPSDAPTLCVDYSIPANYDCPSLQANIGAPCDDGNPETVGETVQPDCSCGGGVTNFFMICSAVNSSSDDAEERVTGYITLTSTDLELIHDSGEDQTVGMRFTDLNIPQGAVVTSASIQFAVDETAQINPCNLTIFGQASDDAATFTTGSQNIISRPGTQASVTWSPPAWSPTGAKGADQQTPDISAVIQEIVNRSGYTSSSAIVIMINGTGQRIAESYDGSPADAPTLCVTYSIPCTSTPVISYSKEDEDCSSGNGWIALDISEGGQPYDFSWNTGATTDSLFNLSAGTYHVTVTDGQGCQDSTQITINNTIDLSLVSTEDQTICLGDSISLSTVPANGTAPYSFSWSTGGTTDTITVLADSSRIYFVTVTDNNGCTAVDTVIVTAQTCSSLVCDTTYLTDLNWVGTPINGSGTVKVDASNEHPDIILDGITYARGLGAHAYSKVTYDLGGQYQYFEAIVGVDDQTCSVGSVIFRVYGDSALLYESPFVYQADTAIHISVDISGVSELWLEAEEDVENTDTYISCDHADWADAKLLVCEPVVCGYPPVISFSAVDEACDQNNGAIALTVSGGTPPFSYAWNTGASTNTLVGLSAGTYRVTVTDLQGCQDSTQIVIDNTASLSLISSNDQTICLGDSVALSAVPVNGLAPYQFSWSTGGTTDTITVLADSSRIYFVTVTDNNGCTAVDTVIVTAQTCSSLVCDTTYLTDLNWVGTPINGSGTVKVDASNEHPDIILDGITYARGLGAHAYSKVTYDLGGQYQYFEAIVGVDDQTCSVGSVIFRVYGDSALLYESPFVYQADTAIHISVDISGVSELWLEAEEDVENTDTYISCDHADWADAKLLVCEPVACADPPVISFTKEDETCSTANGWIALGVSGGSQPYTYTWDNGATTDTLLNLAAGSYTVTVTDTAGCADIQEIVIAGTAAPAITLGADTVICTGTSLVLTYSAINGTPPFQFAWSTGEYTDTIVVSPLAPTMYSVTISDAGGCLASDSILIAAMECGQPACDTTSLMDLTWVSAESDIGPVEINESFGEGQPGDGGPIEIGGEFFATGLGVHANSSIIYALGGQYGTFQSYLGIDDECENIGAVVFEVIADGDTIFTSPLLSYTDTAFFLNLDIAGVDTLQLDVNIGNDADYCDHADWADPILLTCTDTTAYLTLPEINFKETNDACAQSIGSVNLTVAQGTAPFYYFWSSGQRTKNIGGLSAGTYTVTVVDAMGQSATETVTITNVNGLAMASMPDYTICAGENATLNPVPTNGVQSYQYLWSNGFTTSSIVVQPAASSTYTVTITDPNGCEVQDAVTVTVLTPPGAAAGPDHIICLGDSVLIGADPVSELGVNYNWSTGASGTVSAQNSGQIWVSPVATTSYLLTVVDANGCSAADSVQVMVSDFLSLDLDPVNGNCTDTLASITAKVTGGIPPYTFLWSNGATTGQISDLVNGIYTLTLTDAGGCTAIASAEVVTGTPVVVSFEVINESYAGEEDGQITASVTGGLPPYDYRWSNGTIDTTNVLSGLPAGNYGLTVSDSGGCFIEDIAAVQLLHPQDTLVFAQGYINGVGEQWTTVSLPQSFSDMVVVTTVATDDNRPPAVSLVRNAQGSSFEVRTQVPGGGITATDYIVHYFVIEAGVYEKAIHGIDLEAGHFNETSTSYQGSWQGEALTTEHSFVQPVVLGQVLTADTLWSAFWAATVPDPTAVPAGEDISLGKHVGEDILTTRSGSGIDYVVLEAGSGSFNSIGIEAGVSSPSAQGIDSGASIIGLSNSLEGASVAILSAAGMMEADGGWPVLYGSSPVNANRIQLAYEEDQIGDPERSHTAEAVAYLVFEGEDGANSSCGNFRIGINLDQPSCDNGGLGSAEALVDGGVAPYIYEWSNDSTGVVLTDLLPGNYGLTVTDAGGCVADLQFTIEDNEIAFSTLNMEICNLSDYVTASALGTNGVLFQVEGISQQDFNTLVQNAGVDQISLVIDYPTASGTNTESETLYVSGDTTNLMGWSKVVYNALFDTSMLVHIEQSLAAGQCQTACTNFTSLIVQSNQDTVEVIEEEDPIIELVGYKCGEVYTPAIVETGTSLVSADTGQVFFINDFPILLDSVNGANGVFGGSGYIPLPFNKQVVKVIFDGVHVNSQRQIFSGQVDAVADQLIDYADFGVDTLLQIGADICQPPPPPPGYTAEGFDEVDGLDPYGFNAEGIHSETGTEYDENGFDADGNHKDTGEPYNPEGCNRNGLNEQGDKCYLKPKEVLSFVDSVKTLLEGQLTPILTALEQEYQDQLDDRITECNNLRSTMDDLMTTLGFDEAFIYGPNGEYYERGLSQHFTERPQPFQSNDDRDENVALLENTHIQLYNCDLEDMRIQGIYDLVASWLNTSEKETLIAWIIEQLYQLNKEDTDKFIADPAAFTAWLQKEVEEHIEDPSTEDTGYLLPESAPVVHPYELSKQEFRDYGMTASVGSESFLDEDRETAILRELDFQFQQGSQYINGVHRAFFLEELAKVQEEVILTGDMTKKNLLPVQVTKYIGGYGYTIYLDHMYFTPDNAFLDAYLILEDAENTGKKLIFEVLGVPFGPAGTTDTTTLALVSEVELRLNNAAKLILKGDGQNYVDWDCSGFVGMNIDAEIEFCRNYIIPLDPATLDTLPDPERYRLEVNTYITGWLDLNIGINAPPFAVRGLEDIKWEMDSMFIDMSDTITPIFIPPVGYNSPYLLSDKTLSPQWRGFYMKELSATLPNSFNTDTTKTLKVGVSDVLIDGCGVSGSIFAEGLLNIAEGSAGGWPFSIDRFGLNVLHNNLAGAEFDGKINVPIFKDTMKYEALIYPGNLYKFTVMPGDTQEVDLFLAQALLYENSKIDILHKDDGFHAVATLSGEMAFMLPEDSPVKLELPKARFSNFKVSNRSPYFEAGTWEPESLGGGIKMAGFKVDISNVAPYQGETDKEAGLGFNVAISLAEDLGLTASGGFGIMGELEEVNNRQKWKFKEIEVREFYIDQDIKDVLHVKGGLRFFKNNETYGDGFQGFLSAEFKKELGFTAQAVGQFGKVETTKYFFVDVMAQSESIDIPVGPVSINGFGGGVSYHMDNHFDDTDVSLSQEVLLSNLPDIGDSFSGLNYTPDPTIGLGLKAVALLTTTGNEETFNGSIGMEFQFNDSSVGGGLREISLKGNGHFMNPVDISIGPFSSQDTTKAPADRTAPLTAYIDLSYNFNDHIFSGDLNVFLNAGGLLRGAGKNNSLCRAQIYFGANDWFINIGTPDNRCGMIFYSPVGTLSLNSYLDVGTDIPDFPGLPANVRSLSSKIRSNEGLRKSGGGFMFGAAMDLKLKLDKGPVYAFLNAGLGFDIMLRNYGDATCNGNPIGLDGWYAAGQLWAFLEGGVKLFGVPILEAGFATVMQARLPNPFWAQATVAAKVKVLFVTKKFNIAIEIGELCEIEPEDPTDVIGMDIIAFTNPDEGAQGIPTDVQPEVYFNVPIGQYFEVPDLSGNLSKYQANLVSATAAGAAGTFDIPVKAEFFNEKQALRLIPGFLFPANDNIVVTVKVEIKKDGVFFAEEERVFEFQTGTAFDFIPETNVAYTYPVNGMYEFYPEEYKSNQGFIQLISGQPELFYDQGEKNVQMKLSSSGGTPVYAAATYENGTITFPLAPSQLQAGESYQIELVEIAATGEERSLFSRLYFRASPFGTFKEKLAKVSLLPSTVEGKVPDLGTGPKVGITLNGIDPFDAVSLDGTGQMDPLISFEADLSSSWFKNQVKPLIYDQFPYNDPSCGLLDYNENTSAVQDPADAAGIYGQTDNILVTADGFNSGAVDFSTARQHVIYNVHNNAEKHFMTLKLQISACMQRLLSVDDTVPNGFGLEGGTTTLMSHKVDTFFNTRFPPITSGTYLIKARYRLPNGQYTTNDGKIYVDNTGANF